MQKINEIKELRDIKPLVDVPDHSLWLFALVVFATLALIGGLIYYYKKPKRRKRRKATKRELAISRLKNLEFDDTKDTIYTFSKDIQFLANKEQLNKFKAFLDELELYKYKKDVPSISSEDRERMREIIKEITNG